MAVADEVEPEERGRGRAGDGAHGREPRAAPGAGAAAVARPARDRAAPAARAARQDQRARHARRAGRATSASAPAVPAQRHLGFRNSVSRTRSAAKQRGGDGRAPEAPADHRGPRIIESRYGANAGRNRDAPLVAKRAARRALRPPHLPPSRGRATQARAGQFVMIKAGTSAEPPLRRPFSILDRGSRARARSRLFLKAVGAGSRALADLRPGRGRRSAWARSAVPSPRRRAAHEAAAGRRAATASRPSTSSAASSRARAAARARVFYGGRTAADLQLREPFAAWACRWSPPPTTAASAIAGASRSRSTRTSTRTPGPFQALRLRPGRDAARGGAPGRPARRCPRR